MMATSPTTANDDRRRELRGLVKALFETTKPAQTPIDPKAWVDPDEVVLKPHPLRGECDGLIRYREGKFFIFWDPTTGIRARFSLAHEIAHYLIPEHRRLVMSGKANHWSKADFRSDTAIEREADYFAAQLLMPEHLFGQPKPEFKHILKHARTFDVSDTACCLRTIEQSEMAVALVRTAHRKIQWSWSSEEMHAMGFHNYSLRKDKAPPARSLTAQIQGELHDCTCEPRMAKD